MCGVAAVVGRLPDPAIVEACIAGAASRGPDAHGWAIHREPVERRVGAPTPGLGDRLAAYGEPAIFHARLATMGTSSLSDLSDAQPLEDVDGWRFCHNGVVPPPLWEDWRGECRTGNDSEAVLLMCRRLGFKDGLSSLRRFTVLAIGQGGHLFAVRSWLPLFAGERDGCAYLSSRQVEPWMVQLPEREVVRFSVNEPLGRPMGEIPNTVDERWETAGVTPTSAWRRSG